MASLPGAWIIDAEDLDRDVLARSAEVPVVADFWAPWCAPCRALGPVLERLATEHGGAFVLARVNVDEVSGAAERFHVQSIPAVKAFRDGTVVAEFVGAQPEAVVSRFVASILPTEADRRASDGTVRAEAGDVGAAEAAFREALAHDARHPRALLGLARLLAARGENDEALRLLEQVLPGTPLAAAAERLAAELRTCGDVDGDEPALRARVAADPTDVDARLALGRFLAARQQWEAALAELLEAVRRNPGFADGAARKTMIDVFAVLGSGHPLTDRYRGELAKVLFR